MSSPDFNEIHPTVREVVPLRMVTERPVLPLVADLIQAAQEILPAASYVVGAVNGERNRVDIARGMASVGLGATAQAASRRIAGVTDTLNEVAIKRTGLPVIVQADLEQVPSAQPVLADDYLVLRRELCPDLPAVTPYQVIAPSLHPTYAIVEREGVERASAFERIAHHANALTGHLPAGLSEPETQTPRQRIIERMVEVAKPRLATGGDIPAISKTLIKDMEGITPNHLSFVSSDLHTWFGSEPFIHGDHVSGRIGQIIGLDPGVMQEVVQRHDEADQLHGSKKRLQTPDCYGFWEVAPSVNRFLQQLDPTPPLPGLMTIKQTLATYAALDTMPQPQTVPSQARKDSFQAGLAAFLKAFEVLPADQYTAIQDNHQFLRTFKVNVVADLSDGACVGLNPGIMFPDSSKDEQIAKMICAECHVRSDCLDEAIANNYTQGIWGGTTASERRALKPK